MHKQSCDLLGRNNLNEIWFVSKSAWIWSSGPLSLCLLGRRAICIQIYKYLSQQIKEMIFWPRSIPDRVVNGGMVSSIQYVNVIYEYDNIFIGALLDKELLNSKTPQR